MSYWNSTSLSVGRDRDATKRAAQRVAGEKPKGKRIKRVFGRSSQVMHLWANQSQSDARSSNAFFNGREVYSYGTHYLLGELVTFKGQTVALINAHRYSTTTSQHIGEAWQAVSHLPRFSVDSDNWTVLGAVKARRAELLAEMQAHFRGRTFWRDSNWRNDSLRGSIREFNATCDKLKLKRFKVKVTAEYIRDYNAHVQKRLKRQAELSSPEAIEARRLKAEQLAATAVQRWVDGSDRATSAVRSVEPQLIRVKGDKVETSRGAEVSLREAKQLLASIGTGTAKPGDRVGGFSLTRVDGDTVKIGCHTFSLTQVREVLRSGLKAVA